MDVCEQVMNDICGSSGWVGERVRELEIPDSYQRVPVPVSSVSAVCSVYDEALYPQFALDRPLRPLLGECAPPTSLRTVRKPGKLDAGSETAAP